MDKKLRVCFIGLGSIATRHICNLKTMYGEQILIDVVRREEASLEGTNVGKEMAGYINKIYCKNRHKDSLPLDYDAIFITNPTKLHYDTIVGYLAHTKNFFIEKPVFVTGKEDYKKFMDYTDHIYYVACPLRYTKVIQYLKQNIDMSTIYSVRCICSSYLPDWREGIDYRNTYSARKELGGGVSIDLIHEWDYLCYLLGYPEEIKCFTDKKSGLEINSDDIAIYIAKYRDKLLELHLDYFGRIPERKIEFIGEKDTIEADFIAQSVTYRKQNRTIWLKEDRNEYQIRELYHYFDDIITKTGINDNDIERACKILRMARGEVS